MNQTFSYIFWQRKTTTNTTQKGGQTYSVVSSPLAVTGLQIRVLTGAPRSIQAQEQTSGQTPKAAETETEKGADRKFQEGLNNLGLSAGYAMKCSEKASAERQLVEKQALEIGNQLSDKRSWHQSEMFLKSLMLLLSFALPFVIVVSSGAADRVVVEDWAAAALGARGIPTDWTGQDWGHPRYDFTIVADAERKALYLKSENERSTITKSIAGRVHLQDTPILEWQWKILTLPAGGDTRKRETMDQAAQLYVVWPRFPQTLRSRIIGYAWDTLAPVGTSLKSPKASTVTYIIVRSGKAELGQWITERRNLQDDYKLLFDEEPTDPGYISLSIDSNDTHSSAETLVGPILFHAP